MCDERWTNGNSEAFLQLTASSAGVASWEGAWDGAPGPGRRFVQTFPQGDVLCFFRLPVFASNALVIGKEGARLAGNFRETTKNFRCDRQEHLAFLFAASGSRGR